MPVLTTRARNWSLGLAACVVFLLAPFLSLAKLCLEIHGAGWPLPISPIQSQLWRVHLSVRGVITSLPLLPRYS